MHNKRLPAGDILVGPDHNATEAVDEDYRLNKGVKARKAKETKGDKIQDDCWLAPQWCCCAHQNKRGWWPVYRTAFDPVQCQGPPVGRSGAGGGGGCV
jgi:hypothetical protein